MRLIEGVVDESDPRDAEIHELAGRVRDLEADLRNAQRDVTQARRESGRALTELRRQLSPLYRALQGVFGELDAAGVDGTPTVSNPRTAAVWDSWKGRVSPACGKVIDALLSHSELNTAQLKVAAGIGSSTVSDSIFKLNKLGLITKNGGRFSLKAL